MRLNSAFLRLTLLTVWPVLLASCASGASGDEGRHGRGSAAERTVATADLQGGERIFRGSCAACHGANADGNGPVAPFLNVDVPDLTRIAARRAGTFPELEIYGIVDGQGEHPVHGSRHMPVWGYEFFDTEADDDEIAHRHASEKISRVVAWLRSIQRSP
jgi:mono/diheme cytochrome c family protein